MKKSIAGLLFTLFFCFGQASQAQDEPISPPKLFINCASWGCYEDFVRTELNFFDYVRDRFEADIQILIVNQDNAAGGRQYTLTFIGQKNWNGQTETLTFATKQADTEEIMRQKLVRYLKLGLIKFSMPMEFSDDIAIDFKKRAIEETMVKGDKWDYWVFQLGTQGNLSGGSNQFSLWMSNYVSAQRITNNSKFILSGNYNQNIQEFTIQGTKTRVKNENGSGSILYVKSVNEHLSIGGGYSFQHSIFTNYNALNQISPAIEYNAFKTSENTKHQLRFLYQVGIRSHNYIEPTIFDVTHEVLPYQRLNVNLNITRPWGSIGSSLRAFQYLHDARKYSIGAGIDLNWRVFEGFSINLSSSATYIKDQINLRADQVDLSVIFLGGSQLASNFDYWTYFGISYTFGSINNSVVNPRFNDY